MLQRLSIARALLHDPHVLLFDEPHTGLDRDAMTILDNLLLEAHQEGHTIIMTTHHLDSAAQLAERAVIIYRGSIACDTVTSPDLARTYADVTGGIA
jgi:heme exporter protein A